jgi:hypothetical protein
VRVAIIVVVLAACGSDAVDLPDAPGSLCSPYLDGLCSENGRCSYIQTNDPVFDEAILTCGPPPGTVPNGGSCTPVVGSFDDCQFGLVCRVDTCVAFCDHGGPSYPCQTGFCAHGELACYVGCDPVAPACLPGWQCYLPLYHDVDGPGCAPVGTLSVGMACNYAEECGVGLTCVGEVNPHRCQEICVVAGPPCSTGTCTPRNVGDPFGVCI